MLLLSVLHGVACMVPCERDFVGESVRSVERRALLVESTTSHVKVSVRGVDFVVEGDIVACEGELVCGGSRCVAAGEATVDARLGRQRVRAAWRDSFGAFTVVNVHGGVEWRMQVGCGSCGFFFEFLGFQAALRHALATRGLDFQSSGFRCSPKQLK